MKPYVLDLSTIEPERPLIRVDGVVYELAVRGDFGLVQRTRLRRLQKQVQDLASAPAGDDDVSEDDAHALLDALDRIVAMVVRDLPADVRKRLEDDQKVAIVQAFSRAAETPRPGTARAPSPSKSTGERSSRGSNGSTAAARSAG